MFVSDNGWLQGQHRIPGDKFLPYEESLRVPFILRGPGVPTDQTVARPGLEHRLRAHAARRREGARPGRTHGRRLADADRPRPEPAARTGRSRSRRWRRCSSGNIPINAWDRPYKGVRTDRYTYVVYTETGDQELYDRQADPYELHNVADDPGYAAVKAHLAGKLAKLDDCKGSACNVRP